MIRLATRLDIASCVTLGIEFANISKPIHRFNVSERRIREFTNEVIENPDCVCIVLEEQGKIEGILVGMKSAIYFSEDVALQELAWYVKKGSKGIGMLDLFEAEAFRIGCNRVIVGNKPAFYDLSRYYERREYTLLENQYCKVLKG